MVDKMKLRGKLDWLNGEVVIVNISPVLQKRHLKLSMSCDVMGMASNDQSENSISISIFKLLFPYSFVDRRLHTLHVLCAILIMHSET